MYEMYEIYLSFSIFCLIAILLWLFYVTQNVVIENETNNSNYHNKINKIQTVNHECHHILNKASLNLEKQLKEKCNSCVVTEFMNCIGISQEFLWKYGDDRPVKFYTDEYDFWFNNQNNESSMLESVKNIESWNNSFF